MSLLVVNQLKNNEAVDINLRINKSKTIHAVRIKMLKHGTIADGVFKLEVMDGASVLDESALDMTKVAALGTYAQGYFKYELPYPIRINVSASSNYTEITFRISVSGHTDSDSTYLGLIKQHEFKYITEYGVYPSPATMDEGRAWYSPYGLELYTYSNN